MHHTTLLRSALGSILLLAACTPNRPPAPESPGLIRAQQTYQHVLDQYSTGQADNADLQNAELLMLEERINN